VIFVMATRSVSRPVRLTQLLTLTRGRRE